MTEDLGHWICYVDFDPDQWFGFIYKITEKNTGKEYIGKKQFTKLRRKAIKGRKNKKHIRTSSDWQSYTGSSNELNEQISIKGKDNYKFEIISLHKTKGSLHYAEVRSQITEDVLRAKLPDGTRKFYNKIINGVKFLPPEDTVDELQVKNQILLEQANQK